MMQRHEPFPVFRPESKKRTNTYLHPDLEFWTQLIANGNHTKNVDDINAKFRTVVSEGLSCKATYTVSISGEKARLQVFMLQCKSSTNRLRCIFAGVNKSLAGARSAYQWFPPVLQPCAIVCRVLLKYAKHIITAVAAAAQPLNVGQSIIATAWPPPRHTLRNTKHRSHIL